MERRLAAILAADVVGYSRLMGADEQGTLDRLNQCRQNIDRLIDAYHGRFVGSAGDSVLAEFASSVDAVGCAWEIQKSMNTLNEPLPESQRMEFRIGVNLGDVMVEGPQIYGDGVNVAARLEGLADAGGLYDVHGNVWEWTADCWNGSYAGAPDDGAPWVSGECKRRVLRGGSWGIKPIKLRSAHRRGDKRTLRSGKRGFRVGLTLP